MKKRLLIIPALLFIVTAFTQNIYKITITENGTVETIAFEPENNLILNLSTEGIIKGWGYDVFKERGAENYSNKLEKYLGNIVYYSDQDDEVFRGKLKYIGRTLLTYYGSHEGEEFIGKLKSIGNSYIDYFNNFENEAYRGKIKSIGTNSVTWNSSFENEAIRGKLRSLGNTQLEYFTSSADKAFLGKLKRINSTRFTYYNSYDKTELRGRTKSGSQIYFFNGIKYFVKQ